MSTETLERFMLNLREFLQGEEIGDCVIRRQLPSPKAELDVTAEIHVRIELVKKARRQEGSK